MNWNPANRLSDLQRDILRALTARGRPIPEGEGRVTIRHLPTTGDLLDALGRARDRAGFAAVSRSLDRLWKAGLVEGWTGQIAAPGRGRRWCLAEGVTLPAEFQPLPAVPPPERRERRPRKTVPLAVRLLRRGWTAATAAQRRAFLHEVELDVPPF